MSKQLKTINIIFALSDTLICLVAIALFGAAAYWFSKWWIVMFTIVPLALYCNHTLIIEADIDAAQGKGGEDDGAENNRGD